MYLVSSVARVRDVVRLSASFLVVLMECFLLYIIARNGPFVMLETCCLVQLASVVLRTRIFWDSFMPCVVFKAQYLF